LGEVTDKIINLKWDLESYAPKVNTEKIYKLLTLRPHFMDEIVRSSLESAGVKQKNVAKKRG
jgi:hypothetical protein